MGGKYRIVAMPGDGVGPELMKEVVKVLEAVEEVTPRLNLEFNEVDAGATLYKKTGSPFPPGLYETCEKADAFFKGPMGLPGVRHPDGSEIGQDVLLGLRFRFDLYINLRPAKLYPGVSCPIVGKKAGDINFVIVRENTEGLYASHGAGIILRDEVATDTLLITRKGTERIVRFAFEYARKKRGAPLDGKRRVTCIDKSNVLRSYAFFRKVYNEIAIGYPEIERDYAYVDAMTQWLVRKPEWYDVVVAENIFGDILSDLAAVLVGGMGMCPSMNAGDKHAMFEPIHGSAPEHTGKNDVNPIASILSGKMMLEWLADKHNDKAARVAAARIEDAVASTLAERKMRTYDLGGSLKTTEMGSAIAEKVRQLK
jgi:3-isopropylmalate dehydrogenase